MTFDATDEPPVVVRRDVERARSVATRPATVTPVRLGRAALPVLPTAVRAPAFDVDALRPGILHIGCSAFHRAHQALLTQRAIEAEVPATASGTGEPPPWGIVAASLRTSRVTRALTQQDGLYSVLERWPDRTELELVGTVREAMFAPESRPRLDAVFGDPAIHIVTLTVTSSGYCLDPATGRLDADSPQIQTDLRTTEPCTAIGVLAKGLAQRRESGTPPPVVLSCDNMAANGRTLRQACVDYAALTDDGLAGWIGDAVQFPATMVDRIVPGTTDIDRREALQRLGVKDMAPVSAEPFTQWVIERFDGPRPRWDAAGAEYVSDVAPWEASKLRLLNGGHLAVAYLGLLAGATTVAQALDRPGFKAFALRFMLTEQKPTLPPSDHDIDAYARQLLARWENHGVVHCLSRIGRDGSAKLPARLLASLNENLAAGRPAPCTLLAVAAWLLCTTQDATGGVALIDDERGTTLRAMRTAAGDDIGRFVDRVLTVGAVFGEALPRFASLRPSLVQALALVMRGGSPATMAHRLTGTR